MICPFCEKKMIATNIIVDDPKNPLLVNQCPFCNHTIIEETLVTIKKLSKKRVIS